MAPRPGRRGQGSGSGAEVNKGGAAVGAGRPAALCSPSALIQSICSQQIERRLRPEQSSLLCSGILGREKKRGAPELARGAEGSGTGEGSGGGSIPAGTPRSSAQKGTETPPTRPGPPPPRFVWALGGSSPPRDVPGALPPASRHAGLFRMVKIIVPTLGFC